MTTQNEMKLNDKICHVHCMKEIYLEYRRVENYHGFTFNLLCACSCASAHVLLLGFMISLSLEFHIVPISHYFKQFVGSKHFDWISALFLLRSKMIWNREWDKKIRFQSLGNLTVARNEVCQHLFDFGTTNQCQREQTHRRCNAYHSMSENRCEYFRLVSIHVNEHS